MALVEIVAIVVGCIVAVAVLCCILGTVLECAAHVYKYWCPACVHELCGGRRPNPGTAGYQTTHVTSATANCGRPTEPIVLFVKAIPPNYSTVSVSSDQRLTAVGPLCRTSPAAQLSTPDGDDDDEDYTDMSTRQFNHAAVYGRQFYQGARGRQFYLSNRGRRHSGHVVRTGYSRPISSRGFDHVILPNRDYHHQHQQLAGRRDSEGGREGGDRCMCDYGCALTGAGVRSGSGLLGPDCGGYALPHHSRDLERVLITGEYVAYRLIRTGDATTGETGCQRCLGSQMNIDFLRPPPDSSSSSTAGDHYSSILHQPDIVSDIGSCSSGSFVAAAASTATYGVSQTFAICDERHALPVTRSSALNLLPHRCFRDVKPPPSYASIVRK